ncbi:MAG: hypothetical protein ACKPKO_10290, partial [Candidatus Fonsibacter sp.]
LKKKRVAWMIPTALAKKSSGATPMAVWSMGCLHVLTAAPRTMGDMWRIAMSPPSSKTGGMTMLATDYQGPLLSVLLSLTDRGTSSYVSAPPAPQCSGPMRAALRWTTPPVATQVNVYSGLFHDDSAFEAMPATLSQRLNDEQRSQIH